MATYTDTVLSDGEPCRVMRLGIFGMDGVGPELAGPYRYKMEMASGDVIEDFYDPTRFSRPPELPDITGEVVPHSPTYYALLEWQTFKGSVAYEHTTRLPSIVDYVLQVSRFVLENCVSPSDWNRVQTDEDWEKILRAALVPQVTHDVLAETFVRHFSAHYDGQDVLDAMRRIEGGKGGYDSLRVWEIQAMGPLSEEEWAVRSLEERARRVATIALPQLLEALEADRAMKEAKRNSGKNRF